MGNTWEVHKWVEMGDAHKYRYDYVLVWAGESFIVALWNFYKAKRSGIGCVKLEWR